MEGSMNPHPPPRKLILFTSLPLVGGHSALTAGLCRMLRNDFDLIEVWCKPMPGHGHSRPLQKQLEQLGCRVRLLADEDGRASAGAIINAVTSALRERRCTTFVALAMRHLSVALTLALHPAHSVYYHITHDLTPHTIRRLHLYAQCFKNLAFICPATFHEFPGAADNPRFSWVPQSSEIPVAVPEQIIAGKLLPPDAPWRFGLLGRLTPEKGADAMVHFAKTCHTPCELHVAGSGPGEPAFRELADRPDTPCRVLWHGAYDPSTRTEFLRRFFSGIDLLVVPSNDAWETLSMATLEALQHATPALLSNRGGLCSFGLPELGPAPQSVITLTPPKEITDHLATLAISPKPDARTTGPACITHYQTHFSDARIHTRWQKLLRIDGSKKGCH
jgi:glycosyltransferase involved in cell wall biosynthesis